MKKIKPILSAAGLFCLLAGVIFCIKDGLILKWWDTKFVLSASLITAALVTIGQKRGILTKRRSIFIALIGGTGLCFLENLSVMSELERIYAQILVLVNKYYKVSLPIPEKSYVMSDYRFLVILLCLVFGLLVGTGLARKKGIKLVLLPVALSILPGLLLGYPPSVKAIVFLLCGGGFLYSAKGEEEEEGAEVSARATAFGCMIAAFMISFALLGPVSEWMLSHYGSFRAFQLSMEDKALAFMQQYDLFSGVYWLWGTSPGEAVIDNKPPRLGNEPVFQITMEQKPMDTLYFKNFTGGSYDKGVWTGVSKEEFAAFAESQRMEVEKCAAELADYSFGFSKNLEGTIYDTKLQQIEVKQLDKKVNPGIPYFTSIPEEAAYNADGGVNMSGVRSYTVENTMSYVTGEEEEFRVWTENDYRQLETIFAEYNTELIQAYRDEYVEKQYTKLPEGQLKQIVAAAEKGEFINLSSDYTYSFNLEPVPEGEDPVEYFLFQQKKGYCMHFASAAALWYRAYGLPARYASGYIVLPADFKENGDGTYTAVVTRKRAHAWAETFSSFLGWVPLEATPPAYTSELAQAPADMSLAETVQRVEDEMTSQSQKKDASQNEQLLQEPPKAEDEGTTTEETDATRNSLTESQEQDAGLSKKQRELERKKEAVLALLCIAGFILLTSVVFLLRKIIVLHKRRRHFLAGRPGQAVTYITRETLRLLEALGFPDVAKMDEPDFGELVQHRLIFLGKGTFPAFMARAREAAYGNGALTREQADAQLLVYEEIRTHAREKAGSLKRFWWSYVRLL